MYQLPLDNAINVYKSTRLRNILVDIKSNISGPKPQFCNGSQNNQPIALIAWFHLPSAAHEANVSSSPAWPRKKGVHHQIHRDRLSPKSKYISSDYMQSDMHRSYVECMGSIGNTHISFTGTSQLGLPFALAFLALLQTLLFVRFIVISEVITICFLLAGME